MTLRQIAPHPSLMALRQIVYFSVVTRHARVHTHVGVHMRPSLVRPITFALPLFLLFAGVSSSRAQDRRLQPADLFQLEYAADPQISPDGQWVAYVRQWSDNMTDRRYSNIWLVKADGSLHRPLTWGKFEETSARWSPDGKRLAYVSNRSGSAQLYVRWMDTGESYALTNRPRAVGPTLVA